MHSSVPSTQVSVDSVSQRRYFGCGSAALGLLFPTELSKLNHGLRSLGAGRLLRRPPSVTVGEEDFRFWISDFRLSVSRGRRPRNRKSPIENQKFRKLGPCRAWAAGWLQGDPMGRCGFRSRIENRRNFEEKGGAGAASGRRHATRTPSSLSRRGQRGGLDGRRI
jgi:hypothetical protein